MRTRFFVCLTLLLCAFLATAQTVKWRTVAEGNSSQVGKYLFRQIQTEGDWQQIWKALGQRGSAPSVDFTKQEMVILNLDKQNVGGTSVYVETMTFEAGQLMVKAVRKSLRDAPRGSSNPWVAVALDRLGGHLKLQMRDIVGYPVFTPSPCSCARPCRIVHCSCRCHMPDFPYPLDWEVEYDNSYCPVNIQGAYVISSTNDLNQYWSQVFGRVAEDDRPDKPRMNFREESLVAIHLGQRGSGGYSIGIESLQVNNAAETTLRYWENSPNFGDRVTNAITRPYAWLRIPRVTARVTVIKLPGKPLGR
ncbi:MAG: protease complex subunit PrcB family protein [Chthonomonas sp.]|nr:protease complex subunit PrcB family protein [Chthonomonas sp.]